jgi:hypothetical protein
LIDFFAGTLAGVDDRAIIDCAAGKDKDGGMLGA